MNFNSIRFVGTFRSYQQNVLDNAQKHLKDGRIHIVAAPGSGKTILGLELIRRLGKPALVLSPSVTIRQQWGERFGQSFLPQGATADGYISYDLKSPSLITSVTYQALHAAFTKGELKTESGDDTDDTADEQTRERAESFSGFELVAAATAAGIETVCLDEAHHLRSEWQKALEGFVKAMGGKIKLIALTATPPYDSTPAEWNRYSELCGEIDEEIFVPQLVAQKTLCPHQDYIYFSYPTAEEQALLADYRKKAEETSEEIVNGGLFAEAVKSSGILVNGEAAEETILEHDKEFTNVITLATAKGINIPEKNAALALRGKKAAPSLETAQSAFQFVIDNPEIFSEKSSEELRGTLSRAGLIEKRRVCLCADDKISRMLVSSSGKLGSITDIVAAESKALGDGLRMLILTDFIKRDLMKLIGTEEAITSMGTVPVFEAVRRSCGGVRLAALSGGLVIVPDASAAEIVAIAGEKAVNATLKPLGETGYSEAVFSGSNKNKVAILTEAFQRGLVNVLVGTKALLGEGWDSPCINSLILASFVGSFMLSNQMRGRAIRMDKTDPEKASNIWHLVTLGDGKEGESSGSDFDTVKRRFACFLAPAYSTAVIQSGIERADIIKPPYNESGIKGINGKMLSLAADRAGMAKKWDAVVRRGARAEILDVTEIPKEAKPKAYAVGNVFALIAVIAAAVVLVLLTFPLIMSGGTTMPLKLLLAAAYAVAAFFVLKRFIRAMSCLFSPLYTVRPVVNAVVGTMRKTGALESKNARLLLGARGEKVTCSLENATEHEKNLFSSAVSELFSAIDNPRYVLVRRHRVFGNDVYIYSDSYACPSVIGVKKENAAVLAELLRKSGKYDTVYTRNEEGHRVLLKCRRDCRLNANGCAASGKKEVV